MKFIGQILGFPTNMRTEHEKNVFTTGEVARICHVAPRTVSKWFDTGKLRGYRIPGSRDRRIPRTQLTAFMRAHGIPLDDLEGNCCRLLIVDSDIDISIIESLNRFDRYRVRIADNGFEAGATAQQFRPHVIILNADDATEAADICKNIKMTADLQATKVIAAVNEMPEDPKTLEARGFDGWLIKPYSIDRLVRTAEDATNIIT